MSPCPKANPPLPVETVFKRPAPLPIWPPGTGFATRLLSVGDLIVSEATNFEVVWRTRSGGPDNLGATFFEPSTTDDVAQGYKPFIRQSVLAFDRYLRGNMKALVDYNYVWSSIFIWWPKCPDGYKALGLVVTNATQKPSLDKISCIWGAEGINIYTTRPITRGTQAMGVHLGSFVAQVGGVMSDIACLKNINSDLSSMPTLEQIDPIIKAYSPWVYFHPDEKYLPASVEWLFENGGLLYKKGDEGNPIPITPNGSNLPQGGSDDGAYWLNVPDDLDAKDRVKRGDLAIARVYMHVKPMFGATFTNIATWIYYPFNGPAKIRFGPLNFQLPHIGEHIGDWEHVTLRVNNFNGELQSIYFSQHKGGTWLDATDLEFQEGNKAIVYASRYGHAFYSKLGLVLDGRDGIGLRNDCEKADLYLDTGASYTLVAAEYLGSAVVEPLWVNYLRKWGPTVNHILKVEIDEILKIIPKSLRCRFMKFFNKLPREIMEEEGPSSIKVKVSWDGDEI
ncbi:hypothetical protein ACB092_11G267200 [Castanea dentata]